MSREMDAAREAVLRAGEEVLAYYKKGAKTFSKEDSSPVTEADFASERLLFEVLQKEFSYPVLSEETKDSPERRKHEKVWIVDPLDGTQDFLKETDEFSVMLGLAVQGRPVLGAVAVPALNLLYLAEEGKGATLQKGGERSQPLRVSSCSRMEEARLVVSRSHLSEEERAVIDRMGVRSTRRVGSTGVKLGIIAAGEADLFFNLSDKTHQWDTAAPEAILREAGGRLTDVQGSELVYNREDTSNRSGVAGSNGLLHGALVESLSS